ncbi:hypothetical protein DB30_04906 [Enhygromyxa salina]|uniref:Uncharacterized protein n=1 Tax=Enhygromyxa salina TaxID=215803 RepID=A0A0C1ZED6_9BACT|nr:hypothetical protein [Enhygromyxa salina]KIG16034.1 hypothetical protein DB30_04906 [Enhygromyxa salina]
MRSAKLTATLALTGLLGVHGCRGDAPSEQAPHKAPTPIAAPESEPASASASESEPGDPFSGEAAHVIPFADRTSMGYLLLFPPGTDKPEAPTRERLQTLVEQAFPASRGDAELDLLAKLIATAPHTTDLAFGGDLELPEFMDDGGDQPERPDPQPGEPASGDPAASIRDAIINPPTDPAAIEAAAAKAERQRAFDLIGLHIELVSLGLGEDATIPSSVLRDPVLTRELSEDQRRSLLGRSWALLLRADYRNQHAVRGLRLHQTLVRVAAEHYGALIHDPDTRETLSVEAFIDRRLRAAAGNVADQIAIVPFVDPRDPKHLRLSTRGMRRFGAVDIELDGLAADPKLLQQASDLIAGLALALAKEAEVDASGFAVVVPEELEITCELIYQSYSSRDYRPPCSGSVVVHLVERAPEDHDPSEHVVAKIVAPRILSDAPDYDHPKWVAGVLAQLLGS